VGSDLMQRAEVDAQQHRNDHHPDQQPDWQIDTRNLHLAERLDGRRERLSEGNARDDA
jgi:hypothetical protein